MVSQQYKTGDVYGPTSGFAVSDSVLWDSIKDVFTNPYFAPLMADDLSGLPEAYIITGQYDVLRDDGIMYASRLQKAGVKVTLKNYNGMTHMVFHNFKRYEKSRQCKDELITYLKENL